MKSTWATFVCATVLLVLSILPIQAADSAACSEIDGWTGYLRHNGSTEAERTLNDAFNPGEELTIRLTGFEAGVTVEIPIGNVVAQYPYGLNYLNATFVYTIPGEGVQSVRIALVGYDLNFSVSCGTEIDIPPDEPDEPDEPSVPNNPGKPESPPKAPDNRVNWQHGDLLAVIYPSNDEQGNPALDVYSVTQPSQGAFLCRIVQSDLTVPLPAENKLIKQCGEVVNIYQLTTGEIQFNIGPDAEGKTDVFILDDIDSSRIYPSNFQVWNWPTSLNNL
jgi:hypothetical protein